MKTINTSIRTSAVLALHDAHTERSFGAVCINGREATLTVNDGVNLASALTMLEFVYTQPGTIMPDHFHVIDNDVAYAIYDESNTTMTTIMRDWSIGTITTWTTNYAEPHNIRAKAYLM